MRDRQKCDGEIKTAEPKGAFPAVLHMLSEHWKERITNVTGLILIEHFLRVSRRIPGKTRLCTFSYDLVSGHTVRGPLAVFQGEKFN